MCLTWWQQWDTQQTNLITSYLSSQSLKKLLVHPLKGTITQDNSTPSPMSVQGDVAEDWKDFENPWQYYMTATDVRSKLDNNEGKEIVAATLCTVMGANCKRIMSHLPPSTLKQMVRWREPCKQLRTSSERILTPTLACSLTELLL